MTFNPDNVQAFLAFLTIMGAMIGCAVAVTRSLSGLQAAVKSMDKLLDQIVAKADKLETEVNTKVTDMVEDISELKQERSAHHQRIVALEHNAGIG